MTNIAAASIVLPGVGGPGAPSRSLQACAACPTAEPAPSASAGHPRYAEAIAPKPATEGTPHKPAKTTREMLRWSRWWTPTLVSLRITRDARLRFTPGHYARLGIADDTGSPIFRPLSIASAPGDPCLEFLCTLIPGGEFSGRLAKLRVGDSLEVERASFGFLTIDALSPGNDLWLLTTGSGLAPCMSMLRDPGVWNAFDRIVLVHSVRHAEELAYAAELRRLAQEPPDAARRASLRYLPVVTRDPGASALSQRIPALLDDGRLCLAAGATLDPEHSRVLVCGNPAMTRELRGLLGSRGFRTPRRGVPGQAAFEKYW